VSGKTGIPGTLRDRQAISQLNYAFGQRDLIYGPQPMERAEDVALIYSIRLCLNQKRLTLDTDPAIRHA
jgi:hypothetical protein